MLKNWFNFNHKIMTLPDPVLIFLTIVNKVVVDISYARFQLSMKHIFAKIFTFLWRNIENLSQPSCFCYQKLISVNFKCHPGKICSSRVKLVSWHGWHLLAFRPPCTFFWKFCHQSICTNHSFFVLVFYRSSLALYHWSSTQILLDYWGTFYAGGHPNVHFCFW